mmetsp:Transcript_6005/g.6570  ORF Transcript_6005/g.6570 Transcript_6005/m.6570 type:complete len:709 (+) Transcript_6005:52-2178(+)
MVDFLKHLDYTDAIKAEPELKEHLEKVGRTYNEQHKNDENYRQPFFDQDFSNFVILAGLPKVDGEKLDTLYKVLVEKLFPKLGVQNVKNFSINNDGGAIVEFEDTESAQNAATALDDFKLDKQHTIKTCLFDDYDKIVNMSSNYAEPKLLNKEELDNWLLDPRQRDQLLIRSQGVTTMMWFDSLQKEMTPVYANNDGHPIEVPALNDSRITKFVWSKTGAYLAALLPEGVQLFGGPKLVKLDFYPHQGVKNVEFAPNEQYFLSFNGTVIEAPNSENFIVWSVGTIEKLRVFKADQSQGWGSFSWSYNGEYLASVSGDLLGVYELPSMKLIEDVNTKKRTAIGITHLQKISWSPTSNMLIAAAYIPRGKHTGEADSKQKSEFKGNMYVFKFPSKEQIKWRTITWQFRDCQIYWDAHGKKACVVYLRKKGKKKYTTQIQLAEISSKAFSVVEQEFQDVKSVHVDETGRRLAVVYLDPAAKDVQAGTLKYDVEIYKIDDEKTPFKELGKLRDKTISHVLWSTTGSFFALVNNEKGNPNNGFLEFGVIKPNNTLEILKNQRIAYMNRAEWDASGRVFVVTSEGNHFSLWNPLGVQLVKDTMPGIEQVTWRPRPKLVSEEKEKQIIQNIKEYTKRYDIEDDMIVNKLKYEKERVRKERKEEFMKFLEKKKKKWEETKAERVKLFGFDEDKLSDLTYEEIVEDERLQDTQIVPM